MASSKLLASTLLYQTLQSTFTTHHVCPLSTAATIVAVNYHEDDTDGIIMKGVKISGRPLYLDVQATSPVDPRVLDDMLPFYLSHYGNPHSRTHL